MKRKISSIVYAALVCSLFPWMGRSVQAASVSVSAIEEADVISSDGSNIQEGSVIEKESEESLPPGSVIEEGPDGMPPTISAMEEEPDEMSPFGLARDGVPRERKDKDNLEQSGQDQRIPHLFGRQRRPNGRRSPT